MLPKEHKVHVVTKVVLRLLQVILSNPKDFGSTNNNSLMSKEFTLPTNKFKNLFINTK